MSSSIRVKFTGIGKSNLRGAISFMDEPEPLDSQLTATFSSAVHSLLAMSSSIGEATAFEFTARTVSRS